MDITDPSENDKTVLKWVCQMLQMNGKVIANRKKSHEDIALSRKKINESFLNLEKLGYFNLEGNLILTNQKVRDCCKQLG
jgi:hypothetical protein